MRDLERRAIGGGGALLAPQVQLAEHRLLAAGQLRRAFDPSVVLPQRLIDRLAAAEPRTLAELAAIEGVRQWQVGEWGPALLAACA